jgi:hypothetical protein
MTTREEYHAEMQKLREAPKPKATRLSLSDILALMLTRNAGEHDSVTLKLNAKGETQPEVTARSRDGEDLAETAARVTATYDALCEQYRMADSLELRYTATGETLVAGTVAAPRIQAGEAAAVLPCVGILGRQA